MHRFIFVVVLLTCLSFHPSLVLSQDPEGTTNNGNGTNADSPNPYIRGCLQAVLPDWKGRWRVCNSHDPPELRGVICEESPFVDDYLEIRVASGNWASATAVAWLAQIVLSELLGVPSSEEIFTTLTEGWTMIPVSQAVPWQHHQMELCSRNMAAIVELWRIQQTIIHLVRTSSQSYGEVSGKQHRILSSRN